jgi:hypothetical protein
MVEWSRRSVLAALAGASVPLSSYAARAQGAPERFATDDLIDKGHHFFGSVSRGIALTIEEAARRFGQPNGYVLGQEAGGAFIGGLRYGEGLMYTRNAGDQKVYWEGPSVGFDAGANGDRTMMLVYGLPSTQAIFQRFGGLDGSAYFIGGFGFTALTNERVVVVPIRSGLGARLGVALSYLKFTPRPTWNPF